MPAYGFASFADRERDVREAAERWADRGLAVRFGVEVTYERALRGRHPRLAAAASARLRHRLVHISAALAVQGGRRRGRSSRAARSPRSWRRTSTRSIGAARSGLFDTIGHLDFVKRYLVPHVMPADLAAAPELYEPALAALVESGTALEVNASGLRQLPRETYPSAAIVARYRELGGRARDHRLGRAPDRVVRIWPRARRIVTRSRAGFEALDVPARRRPDPASRCRRRARG